MKKTVFILLTICLSVVLLCACGSRDTQPETPAETAAPVVTEAPVADGIPTEPAPTDAPTPEPPVGHENPPATEEMEFLGDAQLSALLLSVRDDYRPGTAGSSLTAIRLAAEIMDWYGTYGSTNLACETMMALGDPGADVAGNPYADKLEEIYSAAVTLWGYSGEMALSDSGYAPLCYPYEMSDVREVFDSLYSGMSNGTEAPVYVRTFRSDDNAQRFMVSAAKVDMLSPENVIQALVNMGVLNEGVAIQAMNYTENGLLLDLNDAFLTQLCSYGTTGEYMLMGALVNSFLQNYSAETVTVTVNGTYPESGHVIYDFPMGFYEDNVAVG